MKKLSFSGLGIIGLIAISSTILTSVPASAGTVVKAIQQTLSCNNGALIQLKGTVCESYNNECDSWNEMYILDKGVADYFSSNGLNLMNETVLQQSVVEYHDFLRNIFAPSNCIAPTKWTGYVTLDNCTAPVTLRLPSTTDSYANVLRLENGGAKIEIIRRQDGKRLNWFFEKCEVR